MTLTEILEKYPIRNTAWFLFEDKYHPYQFVSDASDLGLKPGESIKTAKDPWGRAFPADPVPYTNSDNEIEKWIFVTSVDGSPFNCVILNE
jgi:hypothetical protein